MKNKIMDTAIAKKIFWGWEKWKYSDAFTTSLSENINKIYPQNTTEKITSIEDDLMKAYNQAKEESEE